MYPPYSPYHVGMLQTVLSTLHCAFTVDCGQSYSTAMCCGMYVHIHVSFSLVARTEIPADILSRLQKIDSS